MGYAWLIKIPASSRGPSTIWTASRTSTRTRTITLGSVRRRLFAICLPRQVLIEDCAISARILTSLGHLGFGRWKKPLIDFFEKEILENGHLRACRTALLNHWKPTLDVDSTAFVKKTGELPEVGTPILLDSPVQQFLTRICFMCRIALNQSTSLILSEVSLVRARTRARTRTRTKLNKLKIKKLKNHPPKTTRARARAKRRPTSPSLNRPWKKGPSLVKMYFVLSHRDSTRKNMLPAYNCTISPSPPTVEADLQQAEQA